MHLPPFNQRPPPQEIADMLDTPPNKNSLSRANGCTLLVSLLLAGILGACGGGGGDDDDGGGGGSTTTSNWNQQAYLKAPNAGAGDQLGYSVALSGDTMVVGAVGEDSNQTTITNSDSASTDNSAADAGAVYLYVRSGSSWSQQAYLKAPNAQTNDYFGASVAISGDTIVVGASEEASNQTTITNGSSASADNSAFATGAAYVVVRSGTSWSQQAYLKAPNAQADDNFGVSVAIDGDTLVVGAEAEASNQTTITNGASADNSAAGAGAAYVFVRSGSSWSQQAYLKAPNAQANDLFGHSVAIAGDTIVVGANTESSNQATITNGSSASADNSASEAGAAYVFVRSGSSWSQQAYLKAPDVDGGDNFGVCVAISGNTVVVGADSEDSNQTTITNGPTASANNDQTATGAVYVFVRSGTNWSQQAYLKAPNAGNGDNFGYSVAISGDTIAVGARKEDASQTTVINGASASADNSASQSGAAYVFVRSGSSWSAQAYLKAPNAEAGDEFGTSVAISGSTVAVGAFKEASSQTTITNGASASADNSASQSGAAYVFKLGS
jgi:hypothetical protein